MHHTSRQPSLFLCFLSFFAAIFRSPHTLAREHNGGQCPPYLPHIRTFVDKYTRRPSMS